MLEPQTLKKSLAGLYKKGHERFLDFGCGSEQFLNIARDLGWETTGMDFSPQAINAVRHHGHKGILYDSESVWSSIEDGSFEVIRMNHVIEHLYHPEDVLANLHRLLSVNGRIHIATPNASSFSSAHYKQFWLGLDCPRHIVIYNPTSLSHLLKKVGFNRIEIVHETVTKDMARSIGFKQEHQGIIRPQDVSSKVRDNRLKSILYSPSVISTILKRSDRIHAFATK